MFGIDLFDAALLPAMIVALTGGLISFLSPCVLPIVPPYLAYMGGVSLSEMDETSAARRKALLAALFFVLGLSTVFLLLGFAASALGRFFLAPTRPICRATSVAVSKASPVIITHLCPLF
ncbi:MAG: cytochrome c biogenesis protein CcdA [Pseudomonadota bacterium]